MKSANFFLFFFLTYSAIALGDDRIVSGTVKDDNGQSLPGVNIRVKGTTQGTITDANGQYKLDISGMDDVTLVFTIVGYDRQEIKVGDQTVIDVQMTFSQVMLSEVVVTGYTTIAKKDLSSSIVSVDTKDMQKFASTNFADALEGKVPGVEIATSGDPGSLQYVRIRGIGTINNNEPLYVIDGVPVQNETDMNFLNPNDIESFQVLKDAAAASIYGARAANGVIVITTKKGKGNNKFNIDFYTGVEIPRNSFNVLTPEEDLLFNEGLYAGAYPTPEKFTSAFYIYDSAKNTWNLPDYYNYLGGYAAGDSNADPSKYVLYTDYPDNFSKNNTIMKANKQGTDWYHEMFKPAKMTNIQISASGANEKGSHFISVNYYDYHGILIKNHYQRFQSRFNSTLNISKFLRVGENINLAYQPIDDPRYSQDLRFIFSDPIHPVYDINGYWSPGNPVASRTRAADGTTGYTFRPTGNVFAEMDFLKYFMVRTNFGMDYYEGYTSLFNYTKPEQRLTNPNSLVKQWFHNSNWVLNGTVNFNHTFGDHSIQSLIGAEIRNSFYNTFSGFGNNFRYGDVDPNYRELSNTESGTFTDSKSSDSRMVSMFFNFIYSFKEKYILSGTVRRDGSSRFINFKYGTFPGMSAAWRINREPFLSNLSFINDLKLRASYGFTGNNEVIGGDYPGYTTYTTSLAWSSYDINGTNNSVVPGFAQSSTGNQATGNPDLKWETTRIMNFGLDATLFRNVDLTFEWYSKKTEDMIFSVQQPLESGIFAPINQNIGSMLNMGIDAQINYHYKSLNNNISGSIGISGSHYTNTVLMLDASGNSFVPGITTRVNGSTFGLAPLTRTQAGHPISQIYGYVSDGIWSSKEQIHSILYSDSTGASNAVPGGMKFLDLNGDGKITPDSDQTFIGNPLPKFIYGINLSLNIKNFNITAYFSGVYGNKIYNVLKDLIDEKKRLYEGGKNLPKLDINDGVSYRQSSYFVEDGSFLRCKNLVLGYTIPEKSLLINTGIQKLQIYVQVQNLFTLTKYSGLDPEITVFKMTESNVGLKDINYNDLSTTPRDLTTGVDIGRYPWSRQFIAGINIEF